MTVVIFAVVIFEIKMAHYGSHTSNSDSIEREGLTVTVYKQKKLGTVKYSETYSSDSDGRDNDGSDSDYSITYKSDI